MKTTKLRILISLLIALTALGLAAEWTSAQDQTPEYRLNVKRNFGFSSGSQIKGNFTNSIVGPLDNIKSVTYLINGEEMATVREAPFAFNYRTEDFPTGWHELSAVVTTMDGLTVTTPTRRFQFVTTAESAAATRSIILPLLGGIVLVMVLLVGVQSFLLKDKKNNLPLGAPRQYGLRGGTICKRCQRPFAIHLWALNLMLWRLDRCDYCGHWSLVTRASVEDLRRAEQAELVTGTSTIQNSPASQEDEIKKRLDDSRYIDSNRP
jgi:hypothetical protein